MMKAKFTHSKWVPLTLAAAMLAGGLFTATFDAQAQLLRFRRNRAQAQAGESLKDKLNLTDAQVAQIKTILANEKGTLQPLLKSLHDARSNLRAVVQKPGASEADIRAASAKVAAVEADLAVERAKIHGQLAPILTADQLSKLNQFQQRVDERIDETLKSFGERAVD